MVWIYPYSYRLLFINHRSGSYFTQHDYIGAFDVTPSVTQLVRARSFEDSIPSLLHDLTHHQTYLPSIRPIPNDRHTDMFLHNTTRALHQANAHLPSIPSPSPKRLSSKHGFPVLPTLQLLDRAIPSGLPHVFAPPYPTFFSLLPANFFMHVLDAILDHLIQISSLYAGDVRMRVIVGAGMVSEHAVAFAMRGRGDILETSRCIRL
jgi:hypothetical protein